MVHVIISTLSQISETSYEFFKLNEAAIVSDSTSLNTMFIDLGLS
jgi:hypothetical protein